MKKILTIVLLFLSMSVCLALELPRWVDQPIRVYIPQYGTMSNYMKQAFLAWQNQSNGIVRFKFVNSPNESNIDVEFLDFVQCSAANAVGCAEIQTVNRKYKKAYISIGTKEYQRVRTKSGYTRKMVTRSKNHIYGVMLHEAGHAIGLGHSDDPNSIMYPVDLPTLQYLTKSDIQLLYKKYH